MASGDATIKYFTCENYQEACMLPTTFAAVGAMSFRLCGIQIWRLLAFHAADKRVKRWDVSRRYCKYLSMELDELWYLVNSDTLQLGYKILSYWSHSYAFISAGRKKIFLCYFMTFPFDHRMVPILYMLVYNTCSGLCLFFAHSADRVES